MDIGTIVAGLLTLAILTFLYKDNPVYKMAESILIGVSIGYILVITWTNTLMAILFEPFFTGENYLLAIPFILRSSYARPISSKDFVTFPPADSCHDRFGSRCSHTSHVIQPDVKTDVSFSCPAFYC